MSEAALIADEITSIRAYLKAAEDILESGYMPDITAMENRISVICEKIQKAPKETHETSVKALTELLDQLNQVETKMRTFQATRMGTGS